jgi:hypothetical protein
MPAAIPAQDTAGRSILTIPAVGRREHIARESQDVVAWLRMQLALAPKAQYIVFPRLTLGTIQCILAILAVRNIEIVLRLLATPIAACPHCWALLRQRYHWVPSFPGDRLTTCHCARHLPKRVVA